MLKALSKFSKAHFQREEMLQRACGFPEASPHKEHHTRLINDLNAFIHSLSRMEHGKLDAATVTERLRDTKRFMTHWLIAHILGEDMKLKPYVLAMRDKGCTMPPLASAA